MPTLTKLRPELEAKFPKEIREIREFYFQLSDEDKVKLKEGKLEVREDIKAYLKRPEWMNILDELKVQSQTVTKAKIKVERSIKTFKFCFECGKKINRIANYCEFCGVKQQN